MKTCFVALTLWSAVAFLFAGLAWPEPVVVVNASNTQITGFSVSSIGDEALIVWLQRTDSLGKYHVRMQIILPDGSAKFSPEGIQVSSECVNSINPEAPCILVTPANEIYISWYNSIAGLCQAQLYTSEAQPLWGTEPVSFAGIDSFTRAMYVDGAFILVYPKQSNPGVYRIWGQKIVNGIAVWPDGGIPLVAPHPQYYNAGTQYFWVLGNYLAWNLEAIGQLFVIKIDSDGCPVPGFEAWGSQISLRMSPYQLGDYEFKLLNDNLYCRWHESYEVHPSFEYWSLRHIQQIISPTGDMLIPSPGLVDLDEGDLYALENYGYDPGLGTDGFLTGNGSVNGYRLRRFSCSGSLIADTITPLIPVPHYSGVYVNRLDGLSDGNALLIISSSSALKYELIDLQGQQISPGANSIFEQYIHYSNLSFCRQNDTIFLVAAFTGSSPSSNSLKLQKIVPAGSSSFDPAQKPISFEISQNYPNPFIESTSFRCKTNQTREMDIAVFNSRGQKIATLFQGLIPKGHMDFSWNGKDDKGNPVSNGVYYLKASTENESSRRRIVRLK